jgi:hypothetical protein
MAGEGLQLRGLQADLRSPGHLRYQMLVMQAARQRPTSPAATTWC